LADFQFSTRRSSLRFVAALTTLLMSFSVGQAASAEIGSALSDMWARAASTDVIPILIQMRDRVDVDRDLPQLARGRVDRETRHTLLATELMSRSERSQQSLKVTLQTATQEGQARGVRHFWIDNLVGLEATPALLEQLAGRDDIERMVLLPEVVIDEPERTDVSATAALAEPGLTAIGAPTMWAMGYTGKGRIVCGIDTGVRGTHYALADRWRGLTVPWQQAWFNPLDSLSNFPQDIGTDPLNHGSHTMGTMCGIDTARGDTVGVAIEAEWIAAYGIGSASLNTLDLITCLEWCADPDGNPNTTSDVPDVLNNSWRFAINNIMFPCNDIMDGAISNLEGVGVIAIWAAGNEGPTVGSIGYPANALNALGNNFAVGNINAGTDLLHGSSSRGPTPCTGDSIKPEVVAPGVSIRSVYRGHDSLYGILTGTSMASPHVAGAAAILRQVAPNATPAEIKQALFVSAIDKGAPGEDNDYGNGLINIPAAADSLSAIMGGPDLRVENEQVTAVAGLLAAAGPGDSLQAGDTVGLVFRIRNRSEAPATSVYLRLLNSDPFLTLLTDSVDLGIVAAGDSATAAALRFVVDAQTPQGQPLDLVLHIGAIGFSEMRRLRYYTDPYPARSEFTHDNTLITFTVSNYGLYGLADQSYYPLGGDGFLFDPSATNHMAEAALLIGLSQTQVSDAARRSGGADAGFQISDADFAPAAGGALLQVPNIDSAFETTQSAFDDAAADNPIGIRVTQRSLIFPRGVDEGYVLLIYTLENISGGPLADVYAGILHDCDFPAFLAGNDTTGFNAASNMGYMFDRTNVASGAYRGVAVLSDSGATAFTSINAQSDFYAPNTFEVILTDSAKWSYLSGGIGPPSAGTGVLGDAGTFVGTGPFSFAGDGDTIQLAFAFVGSESGLGILLQNAVAAQARYDLINAGTAVAEGGKVLPTDFALLQNIPNPFNPETKINFSLARPARARLLIYNLLGQRVALVFDGSAAAGRYEVLWDGKDEQGRSVASGVYFYRLEVADQAQTRKMVLLR
jgi:subtilisin family serine protease